MCVGNNFALMEMQIVLAMLVRKFDFSPVQNGEVKPDPLVTLRPKNKLKMNITPIAGSETENA